MTIPHRRVGLTMVALLLLTAGCSNGPEIVSVSGQVLIDGKPLTHGFVQVAPKGFRPASGEIGSDGRFTLTTLNKGDGCLIGTHPVAVIATESIDAGSQRWHAPMKYQDFTTSGLTVKVTGPTDSLKIELTWGGGKPFVQHFGKE
jgi:hypothetical protein